jgi:hypothetical protein
MNRSKSGNAGEGGGSDIVEENCELKERVVQQQSRLMRDDLIFKGIPDDYNPVEDTGGKFKDFIKSELPHVLCHAHLSL